VAEDEEVDNNDIDLEAKETLDPYLTSSHNEGEIVKVEEGNNEE